MLQSFLGGLISAPTLVALLGIIVKASPGLTTTFATWLYSKIDPNKIPYGSVVNEHWNKVEVVSDQLKEIQRDTIKNTLICLLEKKGDHSSEVRYELAKLEKLDAACWIMDLSEEYLKDPHAYYEHHHDQ